MKKPANRLSKAQPEKKAASKVRPAQSEPKQRPRNAPAEPSQARVFDKAVQMLHAGSFERAKILFDQAAAGPSPDMAHASRVHARMCEHRMAKGATPELTSAEDHYNFAITLMNQRSLEMAEEHLQHAMGMSSDEDHLHYAMALCRGLRGDVEGACKHLVRAIELQPKNRMMARNDPDFAELFSHRPLARLLFPEEVPSA
jgi:Tfp pilus assembly protein PilF